MIEHGALQIGLGVVHCLLKEWGELDHLIPAIQEAVEEELDFSGDINDLRA